MKEIELSIVIPAYNEEKIIGKTLDSVLDFFSKKKYTWEVIVVDDGSRDNTVEIVKKFSNKKIKLLRLRRNKGKGGAIKAGVAKAKGKYVVFFDADLSVPVNCVDKFMKLFRGGSSVIICSRRLPGSKIVIAQPMVRESMGRIYTLITKIFLGINVSDFTCGFKGFTKEAARSIFPRVRLNRWSYDSEVIFLARKLGFDINEVAVEWTNRTDTRVRIGSAVATSFIDLIKIRYFDLLGKYDW